jgi:hypothetical protein
VYDAANVVNGSQVQALLAGTHHCLVAEIAYDDAPIINANGVVATPEIQTSFVPMIASTAGPRVVGMGSGLTRRVEMRRTMMLNSWPMVTVVGRSTVKRPAMFSVAPGGIGT